MEITAREIEREDVGAYSLIDGESERECRISLIRDEGGRRKIEGG